MNNINSNLDIKVTGLINAASNNKEMNQTGFINSLFEVITDLSNYLSDHSELMQPLINSLENVEQKLPTLSFKYESKFVMKDVLEYNRAKNTININSEMINYDIDLERYFLKTMIEMSMIPEPGKELINSGLAMMIANNVMLNSNNRDIDNNYDESNYIEYLLVNQLTELVGFENVMNLSFNKNLEMFKSNLSNIYGKEDVTTLFAYFDGHYNTRNMKNNLLLSEIQRLLINMYCKQPNITVEQFNDFSDKLVTKDELGKSGVSYKNLDKVKESIKYNIEVIQNNSIFLSDDMLDYKSKTK